MPFCRDVACNVSTNIFKIIMYIFDNRVKSEIRPPKSEIKFSKRFIIPEWGDGLTKKTPQILPPFYFYFQKKSLLIQIQDRINNILNRIGEGELFHFFTHLDGAFLIFQ